MREMMGHSPTMRSIMIAAGTCGVLLGCADLLDPVQIVQPEVTEVQIGVIGSGHDALIGVSATVAGNRGPLGERDRLETTIRSRGGGLNQTLMLQPEWCGPVEDSYRCDNVLVLLDPGADLDRLHARVRELPGRLVLASIRSGDEDSVVHASTTLGTIYLLEGSAKSARRTAAGWPEVRTAELIKPGYIATDRSRAVRFVGYLPLTDVVGQAGFSLRDGPVEIVVEYEQPDGEVLESVASFPG